MWHKSLTEPYTIRIYQKPRKKGPKKLTPTFSTNWYPPSPCFPSSSSEFSCSSFLFSFIFRILEQNKSSRWWFLSARDWASPGSTLFLPAVTLIADAKFLIRLYYKNQGIIYFKINSKFSCIFWQYILQTTYFRFLSDRLFAVWSLIRFSWENVACLGMVCGAPIWTGSSFFPLWSWTTPPLVETPWLSAIVFRVEVATLDLDLTEVFRTMLERFETLWAL